MAPLCLGVSGHVESGLSAAGVGKPHLAPVVCQGSGLEQLAFAAIQSVTGW